MIRDFVFDSGGLVVAYRCRTTVTANGKEPKAGDTPWQFCNRIFSTPRGLWQHQRVAHKIHQQLWLYPERE